MQNKIFITIFLHLNTLVCPIFQKLCAVSHSYRKTALCDVTKDSEEIDSFFHDLSYEFSPLACGIKKKNSKMGLIWDLYTFH